MIYLKQIFLYGHNKLFTNPPNRLSVKLTKNHHSFMHQHSWIRKRTNKYIYKW